ncbi:MAG: hypothetical protein NWE83_08595 [Candidatus Bathyarchaeota archaeon]|nr:hypothetical protein [Candidatus Bathyarchaeota archaeon]
MVNAKKKQKNQGKQRGRRLQPTLVNLGDEGAIWHHLQLDNHFPWIQ